jgi:predicted Zn finger-like uncharacterized protein
MAIQFQCQHCGATLKVKDGLGGKNVKCPKCEEVIKIPSASDAEPEAPARVQGETQASRSGGTSNLKKWGLLGGVSLAIIAVVVIGAVALIGGGSIGSSSTWAEAAPVVNGIFKKALSRIEEAHKQDRPSSEVWAIRDKRDAAALAVAQKLPLLVFENHCSELFAIVDVGKPVKLLAECLYIPVTIEPKRKLESGRRGKQIALLVHSYNESGVVLDSHRQGLRVGDTEHLLPGQRYQVVLRVPWKYYDHAKSDLHHISVQQDGEW